MSLAAGTWLIGGCVLVNDTAAAGTFTGKLWDGTTVASSAQLRTVSAGLPAELALPPAIVSPVGTTTYKISVACDDAGMKILAAAPTNGAGNNASAIVAVQIS